MSASVTLSTAVARPKAGNIPSDSTRADSEPPTILYVGQNPAAGTGSPIIVLRHLQRFAAAGWRIVVVADYGSHGGPCEAAGWTVVNLPLRRWWWPPYRDRFAASRWLRLRLLAADVLAQAPKPDVIFSYLAAHADFSADLAGHLAKQSGAPLHILAHDDAASFPYAKGRETELRRAHDRILGAADVCWFVSPELAEVYPSARRNGRLLNPIPEGWASPAVWREDLAHHSPIYYAGHLWPEQLPLMRRVARAASAAGCELVLMARQTEALREFCLSESARWQPQFPTNQEALAHLVSDASAVLVSYADAVADMPWCATSFPSKLVEYCHLGVPIAIVAPPDSSVAKWAKRVAFPYFFNPGDLAPLQAWCAGLKNRTTWETCAAASLQLARSEFNPERIQAVLANAMMAGTERRLT